MKKKLKAVIVPINKKGWDKNDIVASLDGSVAMANEDNNLHHLGGICAHNLLFIDESADIKNGDWAMCDMNGIFKADKISEQLYPALDNHHNKRVNKIIASYPKLDGTLPISITDAREWCNNPSEDVEIEMEEMVMVTKDDILNAKGNAPHIWQPKLSPDGCIIRVKGERAFKPFNIMKQLAEMNNYEETLYQSGYTAAQQQNESDCIGFAGWMQEQGYISGKIDGVRLYALKLPNEEYLTISQLYALWQKNKKQ